MDELALACTIDPIEFRVRNEPSVDPEEGLPFSSCNLIACLCDGAAHFGWHERDPRPGVRRDGRWLVGTGVAASVYPTRRQPSSASARVDHEGNYSVLVDATDIGIGARTVLTKIAADALGVGIDRIHVEIGDTDLPRAPLACGSIGTAALLRGGPAELAKRFRRRGVVLATRDSSRSRGQSLPGR